MTTIPVDFSMVCSQTEWRLKKKDGIGTLGEKTVHAVLKKYLEPREDCHEIKIDGYYADIVTDEGIIEIQTRQFDRLRKKLEVFLKQSSVTIVYPIPHRKWIYWIEEETGEISKKRKSPKMGNIYAVFPELYKIKNFLWHPNLSIHLFLIDMEEYRLLNGWSQDRKKGSTRYDRIPLMLTGEFWIKNTDDYKEMVPQALSEEFTAKEFQKESGLSLSKAQTALNILHYMDAVERVGKKGRAYLYRRNEKHIVP